MYDVVISSLGERTCCCVAVRRAAEHAAAAATAAAAAAEAAAAAQACCHVPKCMATAAQQKGDVDGGRLIP